MTSLLPVKQFYIEPAEIVEIIMRSLSLNMRNEGEIVRILIAFADNIRPYIWTTFLFQTSLLGEIDFIRAKAFAWHQFNSIKPY